MRLESESTKEKSNARPRSLARGTALLLTGVLAACADTGPTGLDMPELEVNDQIESCQPDAGMDESLLNDSQDDLLGGPKGKKGGWGATLWGRYSWGSTSGSTGTTTTGTSGYLKTGSSTKVDAGGTSAGKAGAEGVCNR